MATKAQMEAKLAELSKEFKAKVGEPKNKVSKRIIKKDIQGKVDYYIELDAQYKSLEKELKALRKVIEPYMIAQDIDVIMGTEKGRIERVPVNRAVISANFTSYNVEDIKPFIKGLPEAKQVIVEAVNKEVLDALVKLGKVPEEVQEYKVMTPSMNFSAKQV